MELEFSLDGETIEVTDMGRPRHFADDESGGVVWRVGGQSPLGELHRKGAVVTATLLDGTSVGKFDTDEEAAKAVAKAVLGGREG